MMTTGYYGNWSAAEKEPKSIRISGVGKYTFHLEDRNTGKKTKDMNTSQPTLTHLQNDDGSWGNWSSGKYRVRYNTVRLPACDIQVYKKENYVGSMNAPSRYERRLDPRRHGSVMFASWDSDASKWGDYAPISSIKLAGWGLTVVQLVDKDRKKTKPISSSQASLTCLQSEDGSWEDWNNRVQKLEYNCSDPR